MLFNGGGWNGETRLVWMQMSCRHPAWLCCTRRGGLSYVQVGCEVPAGHVGWDAEGDRQSFVPVPNPTLRISRAQSGFQWCDVTPRFFSFFYLPFRGFFWPKMGFFPTPPFLRLHLRTAPGVGPRARWHPSDASLCWLINYLFTYWDEKIGNIGSGNLKVTPKLPLFYFFLLWIIPLSKKGDV